jgi:Photosynthesis system II assembly factor YCF48
MPTDDREQQFDRALARHLRNASHDSACPDAETLAAYHERSLSLEEMASWKDHIFACQRCQETLALVEQSESVPAAEWEHDAKLVDLGHAALLHSMRAASPDTPQHQVLRSASSMAAPAPSAPLRIRPSWRAIVPIGALAAAVIVWIGVWEVRTLHTRQMNEAQIAQNRPTPPPILQPSPVQSDQSKRDESPSQRMPVPQKSIPTPSVGPSTPLAATPSAPDRISPPSASDLAFSKKQESLAANAGQAVSKSQPPSSVSGYMAKSRSVEALPSPAAKVAAPSGAAPAAEAKRKDENERVLVPSTAETVEVQSAAPTLTTNSSQTVELDQANVTNLVQLAQTDRRYIVAPGEKHAWRLGDAGKIERTTDRGKTWKLQNSGVTADLTAGSATSDRICWVIGKAGTVLLTTDAGKHWKLISTPITADLGGIHATDAAHASIWDVPNRNSFQTTDGGVTWTRTANE